MLLSPFPFYFPSNLRGKPHFIVLLMAILGKIGTVSLCDHLTDVPWEGVFKFGASAAVIEFCEWAQVGIDVYIPHRKYQVNPHSSPWFLAACAAAIAHRNNFRYYEYNKSSASNVKFIQAINHGKRVLEDAKLAYTNKAKESITYQKLRSRDLWRIANSVLKKVKSNIASLLTDLRCYLLLLIK